MRRDICQRREPDLALRVHVFDQALGRKRPRQPTAEKRVPNRNPQAAAFPHGIELFFEQV